MKTTVIFLIFVSLLSVSCKEKFDFTKVQLAGSEWTAANSSEIYTLSFYASGDSCRLITDSKIDSRHEGEILKYETGNEVINLYFKANRQTVKYIGQLISENTLYLTTWDDDEAERLAFPRFTR